MEDAVNPEAFKEFYIVHASGLVLDAAGGKKGDLLKVTTKQGKFSQIFRFTSDGKIINKKTGFVLGA